MSPSRLIALAAVVTVVSGCGSDSPEEDAAATAVLEDLQGLREGEILIKGSRAPYVYGPYTANAGTYRLRYEHGEGQSTAGRLVVAVQTSKSADDPSATTAIDSRRAMGSETVRIGAKLFVNVREARAPYVLRFTPGR